jgi:hypothetical protein
MTSELCRFMTLCLHRFLIPDFRRFMTLELCRFMTPCLHRFATSGLRKFMIPDLHRFPTSGLRRFKIPDLHRFATSGLRRFKILDFHWFATSGLRRFKIPNLHRINPPWNLISWISSNPTFRRWKIFPEFPNTSPSGKRVDSDNPNPQNFRILVKKCHPRNVGVDTRPPGTSQRSNRGGFLKLPPHPYK